MKFQQLSFKRYSIGLIYTAVVCTAMLLFFYLLGFFSMVVATALIIGSASGHLIGCIVAEPPKRQRKLKPETSGTKTIYVGNLAFGTTRSDLKNLFAKYGRVHSTRIMIDRITRKPRGFGFVEMDAKNADTAINALNSTEFNGRTLKVNEANVKNTRDAKQS